MLLAHPANSERAVIYTSPKDALRDALEGTGRSRRIKASQSASERRTVLLQIGPKLYQ